MSKDAGTVQVERVMQGLPATERTAADVLRAAAYRDWLVWIAVLILPALIAAAAAYAVSTLLPRTYAAQADIVFSLPQVAAVPEQYRGTQVVVATSHAVIEPVAAALKLPIDRVATSLSVDFPKDGGVLRLQYADTDKALALRALEAVMDQYLLVLDQLDTLDAATFHLLTPPFLVEDPIWPKPALASALGAAFGLAIGLAALVVLINLRSNSSHGGS